MPARYLILGATGGIGSALARRLVAAGHGVVLAGRDAEKLQSLADETGMPTAVCDVTRPEELRRTVELASEAGQLAGLAYCVGSIVLKPLKVSRDQDFTDAFALNVLGAAAALRAAEGALRAGRGSVVLFSTVAVAQGFANHSVISAAKGAVEGLTRALAAEWAPDVRVNAIAPSLTVTPLSAGLTRTPAIADGLARMHPLGRLGAADDIAAAAAFLLLPDSSWITGQVIGVDGGRATLRVKA